jgi:hypothetical protein
MRGFSVTGWGTSALQAITMKTLASRELKVTGKAIEKVEPREFFSPARGDGIEPGVSTPGRQPPPISSPVGAVGSPSGFIPTIIRRLYRAPEEGSGAPWS